MRNDGVGEAPSKANQLKELVSLNADEGRLKQKVEALCELGPRERGARQLEGRGTRSRFSLDLYSYVHVWGGEIALPMIETVSERRESTAVQNRAETMKGGYWRKSAEEA